MFHSYFYTPFMDASCAISVLSALLRRLQFNAVVCACRAIWKGETALQEMLPAWQTIAKSPCRGVFNANPGFEYRSNFFPSFFLFFYYATVPLFTTLRNNWTLSLRSYELHGNTLRRNLNLPYFSIKTDYNIMNNWYREFFHLDLFFNNTPFSIMI